MKKFKTYFEKTKHILISCPRLLMIFGILIGITITCFAGSIFIKNTNNKNNKIAEENNNQEDTINISDDSLNRVVDAIKDTIDSEYNNGENSNQNNIVNNSNDNNDSIVLEDSVLDYFDNTYNMIAASEKDDKNMVDKIKEKLNVISDFLFNGGTINGYTYNELSDEAKLKINKLTLSIDSKIDEKFPNYKNKIKQSFKNLKGKVTIAYLDTVDKICTNDRQTLCDEAKKDFNKMKDTFKLTFSMIKDLLKTGTTNIVKYFNN